MLSVDARVKNRGPGPPILKRSLNAAERVDHQHSGIIAVMRVGLDGKMRPNSPPMPRLEDQTDELVASADSGVVEPTQMKIGLVVGEPKTSAELEAAYGGIQEIDEVEFIEEDDEAPGALSPWRRRDCPHYSGWRDRLRCDLAKCFALSPQ